MSDPTNNLPTGGPVSIWWLLPPVVAWLYLLFSAVRAVANMGAG